MTLILSYYIIFCLATVIAVMTLICKPVMDQVQDYVDIECIPCFYVGQAVMIFIIAPVAFIGVIFNAEKFRDTLLKTIVDSFNG